MIVFRPLISSDLAAFDLSFLKTKIEGFTRAYGDCPGILETWAQEKDDTVTALIGRFGGEVSVVAKNEDTPELAEFLRVLGVPVWSEDPLAVRLGFAVVDRAAVYRKDIRCETTAPGFFRTEHFEVTAKRLSRADSPDIELADETALIADLSHRVRHGAALVAETETATAAVGFLTEEAAILSGIVTEKTQRGRGEARRLLTALESTLNRKTLFAATRAAEGFYTACGFQKTGSVFLLSPERASKETDAIGKIKESAL